MPFADCCGSRAPNVGCSRPTGALFYLDIAMTTEGKVIAYPGDRPPMLVTEPCSFGGAVWQYAEATPQNAAAAIAVHDRDWSDWTVDDGLLDLARAASAR